MTTHISARLAWHMDGWNGHICRNPAANTYCVGLASYPGHVIREHRDLEWEVQHHGRPVPDALQNMDWYEEGKVHETLADFMVRSKSEVIIANMLAERKLSFAYETPLFAPDGTFYLPDFTITWRGVPGIGSIWGEWTRNAIAITGKPSAPGTRRTFPAGC